MTDKEFRKQLVELVKASGQEVIDRAEDLVGEGDALLEFDIWLRFSSDSIPTIEVSKSYCSKNTITVLANQK